MANLFYKPRADKLINTTLRDEKPVLPAEFHARVLLF